MSEKIDISIIIVNYNTKDLIRNCINSIYEHTKDINFEIIVSDNGSNDGSVKMLKADFPNVVLIENNANLGFGAANNRGLDLAKGKYIFYLNSDTVLLNNAVKLFFDYWENADNKDEIGALGCMLQDENGNYIHSFGKFPTYRNEIKTLIKQNLSISVNQIFSFLHIPNMHKDIIPCEVYTGEVEYVTGADLFCRNNEFARFDERFFLYFEETDLQYKMYQANLRRKIITGPEIIHLTGQSNNAKRESIYRYISFSSREILVSRLLYFMKNYYKTVPLKRVYILSVLYLTHLPFIMKTKDTRSRIKKLFKSASFEE